MQNWLEEVWAVLLTLLRCPWKKARSGIGRRCFTSDETFGLTSPPGKCRHPQEMWSTLAFGAESLFISHKFSLKWQFSAPVGLWIQNTLTTPQWPSNRKEKCTELFWCWSSRDVILENGNVGGSLRMAKILRSQFSLWRENQTRWS